MAVLFMDGFDAEDFAMKWTSGAAITSSTTRFGSGKSVTFTIGNSLKKNIQTSSALYAGIAVYANSIQYNVHSNPGIIAFYGDNGATRHIDLRPITATALGLYCGGSLRGTFMISFKVWHYIELFATISDTVGEYTLKVNGATVLSGTNIDTKNGGTNSSVDYVEISRADNSDFILDDLYISDSEFMGDVRIQTLVPSAAGSSAQLTPTGGANYANVADIPDSTATYNASSTVGNKDLYTLGDLAATTTTVKCVQVNTHSWKDDAGTASLKAKIKSGTTEADGATTSLPSSVAWVGDRWETDPDTSAAWTVSAVNSLEAGAEVA